MIAQVIVDIANSQVDKVFDYILTQNAQIGSRVIVPFGKLKIEGIVIGIKEKSDLPLEKLKPIIRLVEEDTALTTEMISLMGYMVQKYHIPRALALRQFLPSEMRKGKVRAKLVRYATLSNTDFSQIKKTATARLSALNYLK